MLESVGESQRTSIRRRGQKISNFDRSQRILTEDLRLHTCNVQSTQEPKPNDHPKCIEFVEWIIGHRQLCADFSNKIILSDEARFHLDSFVADHQNCRVWG